MLRLFIVIKDFMCDGQCNIARPSTARHYPSEVELDVLSAPTIYLARMLDWIGLSITGVSERSQKQTRLTRHKYAPTAGRDEWR